LSKLAFVVAMVLGGAALLAFPGSGFAQTNYYGTNGIEYSVLGSMPGDQMFPDVAVTSKGGYLVWQDNVTDGSGWGISAERLDSTFSGNLSPFRVNVTGTNDQQNPRVAILKNGGAAFVWQGGPNKAQHIYARFLTPTNTWLTTTDLVVSTFTNSFQITPALTVLNNSNVVVVWSSYNQVNTNSMLDVYGKILSPTGQTISNQFLINQFTGFNQRTPAVAALKSGGFVVAWVSEQERSTNTPISTTYYTATSIPMPSVDIYARLYNSTGKAVTNEFLVNTNSFPCANPSVAAGSDGGFMVAWSQHDQIDTANGWDIYARPFATNGVGKSIFLVNSFQYGDQYTPKISAIGLDYMIVWTSLGQDGSKEGVFGQFVHNNGALVGNEFQVNTTYVGSQIQPAVASDGAAWFDVVWTSFTGVNYGFDLYAQRYANVSAVLQPMSAPVVIATFNLSNNIYVPQLQVSWPLVSGLSISNYEVYVDYSSTPAAVLTSNLWYANGLRTNTTYSFQVDYWTTDGRQSPLSPVTTGTTWSGVAYFGLTNEVSNTSKIVTSGGVSYGIPIEWMKAYYGNNTASWPANIYAPLTPGGFSLLKVFLSGGDPLDSGTWLTTALVQTSEGYFLNWNTQPGQTYQVQETTDLINWSNVGSARYAAGTNDSIYVGGPPAGFYRVELSQ